MADIGSYNLAEKWALQGLHSADWAKSFSPYLFKSTNFPTQIETLQELPMLFESMTSISREDMLTETRGLSDADLDLLKKVSKEFVKFFMTTFHSNDIVFPSETLLREFLNYATILPRLTNSDVLDIGSGLGYLPLFFQSGVSPRTYRHFDVTQSFFISQSLFCSYVFEERYRDLSLERNSTTEIGSHNDVDFGRDNGRFFPVRLKVPSKVSFEGIPWWKLDRLWQRKYDLVISNANVFEMDPMAFFILFAGVRKALKPDGMIIHRGLGFSKTVFSSSQLFRYWEQFGFRALSFVTPKSGHAPVGAEVVILVGPKHPDYDRATSDFSTPFLASDVPVVREMLNLDKPTRPNPDWNDLLGTILSR